MATAKLAEPGLLEVERQRGRAAAQVISRASRATWKTAPSEYSCPDPIRQALSRTRTGLEQCCGSLLGGSHGRQRRFMTGPRHALTRSRASREQRCVNHAGPQYRHARDPGCSGHLRRPAGRQLLADRADLPCARGSRGQSRSRGQSPQLGRPLRSSRGRELDLEG